MLCGTLIADFDVNPWQSTTSPAFQTVIYIGVLVLVILLIFVWAKFWRVPARRQHTRGRHPVSHHEAVTPLPAPRKRRPLLFRMLGLNGHRRQHRRRVTNPTLADAGGLPPQRDEHPPAV
jgi:hypothetical protein